MKALRIVLATWAGLAVVQWFTSPAVMFVVGLGVAAGYLAGRIRGKGDALTEAARRITAAEPERTFRVIDGAGK